MNTVSAIPNVNLLQLKQDFELSKFKAAIYLGQPRITDKQVINLMNLDCHRSMIPKVLAGVTSRRVTTAIAQFIIAFNPEQNSPDIEKWLKAQNKLFRNTPILKKVLKNIKASNAII